MLGFSDAITRELPYIYPVIILTVVLDRKNFDGKQTRERQLFERMHYKGRGINLLSQEVSVLIMTFQVVKHRIAKAI